MDATGSERGANLRYAVTTEEGEMDPAAQDPLLGVDAPAPSGLA